MLVEEYVTNLPIGNESVRVGVELLLEVTTQVWWAAIPLVGVGAAGSSPGDAALTAMRAAVALM